MIASARSTTHRGWNVRARVALALSVAVIALVTGTLSSASASDAHRGAAGKARISYFFVRSLHTRPWRITPGPDGNLWFTDTNSDMIGKITPDGQVTEYPIGDGKVPYDIVAGRDGNLWFTENVNDKTGAVNTGGELIHEYYAPGVDARPTGITVAPNGDIWWVDSGAGQDVENDVSHLTKGGEVINHQLYPCACFGIGITVGPDAKLWAVEELGVADSEAKGTVDRISNNGNTVKRYGIPAPPFSDQHLPAWDAAGPDGRVWFTELSDVQHAVGAVTHGGSIVEYGLPGSPSNTGSITTGIDGNLWVTEPDANRVTVLRPDGSFVRSYTVHQEPMGITIGPDGNMWFANALSGEIGRIPTAAPNTGYVLDIAPGLVPAARTIALGDTVQWVLEAPGTHRVFDETGLVQFDSGPQPPVSFYQHAFEWAGTWGYQDTINGDAGSIGVPVNAPASAAVGSRIPVTWATAAAEIGLFFDVQYLPPGGSDWVTWKNGVKADARVAAGDRCRHLPVPVADPRPGPHRGPRLVTARVGRRVLTETTTDRASGSGLRRPARSRPRVVRVDRADCRAPRDAAATGDGHAVLRRHHRLVAGLQLSRHAGGLGGVGDHRVSHPAQDRRRDVVADEAPTRVRQPGQADRSEDLRRRRPRRAAVGGADEARVQLAGRRVQAVFG